VPIDRESVLQIAQKYAEKKKYDRAIVEYQKIIQVDPSDVRTLLKMGDLQVKMGAHADSIATYERVGRHYVALGFFVKAVWVYKQIAEILTKHVPHLEERYAHVAPKLAELYQNLGLTSDALATLDGAPLPFGNGAQRPARSLRISACTWSRASSPSGTVELYQANSGDRPSLPFNGSTCRKPVLRTVLPAAKMIGV